MTDNATNLVQEYKPTFSQRIWRSLGFGPRWDEELFEWRSADPTEGDWWKPGAVATHVHASVSFLDRLRLLVSGKCRVAVYTRTSTIVERAESRSQFTVHPPGRDT